MKQHDNRLEFSFSSMILIAAGNGNVHIMIRDFFWYGLVLMAKLANDHCVSAIFRVLRVL